MKLSFYCCKNRGHLRLWVIIIHNFWLNNWLLWTPALGGNWSWQILLDLHPLRKKTTHFIEKILRQVLWCCMSLEIKCIFYLFLTAKTRSLIVWIISYTSFLNKEVISSILTIHNFHHVKFVFCHEFFSDARSELHLLFVLIANFIINFLSNNNVVMIVELLT